MTKEAVYLISAFAVCAPLNSPPFFLFLFGLFFSGGTSAGVHLPLRRGRGERGDDRND